MVEKVGHMAEKVGCGRESGTCGTGERWDMCKKKKDAREVVKNWWDMCKRVMEGQKLEIWSDRLLKAEMTGVWIGTC